jgi:uncharacterized protein
MRLAFTPAPDDPAVQAASYGPVVLAGLYGASYSATTSVPDSAFAPSTSSGAAVSPGAGAVRAAGATSDTGSTTGRLLPALDVGSVRRTDADPMTFEATVGAERVTLVPVARAQHKPYTVYWDTDRAL